MFSSIIEEKLFRIEVVRDRALTYKTEECQLTAVEEVFVEQDKDGHVSKKICRVRVFFLSFLTGMPYVELGVNDMTRMGLEVVGRHDILPVPTEQWIRYEDVEFHHVVEREYMVRLCPCMMSHCTCETIAPGQQVQCSPTLTSIYLH